MPEAVAQPLGTPEQRRWNQLAAELATALTTDPLTKAAALRAVYMAEITLEATNELQASLRDIASKDLDEPAMRAILSEVRGFAKAKASVQVQQPAEDPHRVEQREFELARALKREDPFEREANSLLHNVLSVKFPDSADRLDAVKWLAAAISGLSSDLRVAEREIGDEGLTEKLIEPIKLLRTLCYANGDQFSNCFDREVADSGRSWEDLVLMAKNCISNYTEVDDDMVCSELEAYARRFDWEKQYLSDDGVPCSPSAEFAVRVSKIAQRAPSIRDGQSNAHWPFIKAVTTAMPFWTTRFLRQEDKDFRSTLLSIQKIPRDAFEKEASRKTREREELLAAVRPEWQAVLSKTAALSMRPSLVRNQPTGNQNNGPDVPVRPYGNGGGQVERTGTGAGGQQATFFLNFKMQKGLSKEQAKPLSFADTESGMAAYTKALASFRKMYSSDPENMAITVAFPLTPGTLPPATRSCDRCEQGKDHFLANQCTSTPVTDEERNYRRAWRWVVSRANAPSWGNSKSLAVNLIPNIDELMSGFHELYEDSSGLDLIYTSPYHDDYEASGKASE
jgi:hypothetical protein